MFRALFFAVSVVLTIGHVSSRVFYTDLPTSNYYPIYPDETVSEQASKDLDLTFSAGDPGDNFETGVYPTKKVFPYSSLVRRPIYEINHELERPTHYHAPEVPVRKIIYGDPYIMYPERNRKLVKLNNPHKGEVVLELRVIANNNGV